MRSIYITNLFYAKNFVVSTKKKGAKMLPFVNKTAEISEYFQK